MKAEAHDQRGDDQPGKARQEPGQRSAEAKKNYGEGREPVLPDDQHDEHRQQGQEPGDFPHRADDPDLQAVEAGDLHGEVVEQDHPALQPDH